MRKVLIVMLFLFLSGGVQGSMLISSDVHSHNFGAEVEGSIIWQISGEEADALRYSLAKNYDVNHDGVLQLSEISSYMHSLTTRLVHQIVGLARVEKAYPFHGWKDGLVNREDARGLTQLNSSGIIMISVKFQGIVIEDGSLGAMTLARLPLAVASNRNISEIFIPPQDVSVQHTEMLISQVPYGRFQNAVVIRAVMGTYFYYRGHAPSNEEMVRSSVPIIYSPLVLFLILIFSSHIASIFVRRIALSKNVQNFKIQKVNFYFRLALLIFYFPSQLIFYFPGWLFILLCLLYPFLMYYLSFKWCIDDSGVFHAKFLFVFNSTGDEILHYSFGGDIESEISQAISEFIREGLVAGRLIDFEYDKYKVLIMLGKCIVFSVAGKGRDWNSIAESMQVMLNRLEDECSKCDDCVAERLNEKLMEYWLHTKFN